jgi:acetyltransferase-like isoleucine patch superfamily enzyme
MTKPWIDKTPARYTEHLTSDGEPYFVHEMASLDSNVSVGRYSYIHGNTRVTGSQPMIIGKFCSIASGVRLHCGDEHDLKHVSTFPFSTILGMNLNYAEVRGAGIFIGNDVWIGEGVRILSGASVGHGAVLGAGSIVKGNIESYGIYAGNPARLIRKRFSEHKISVLNELCWWDWSLKEIENNMDFFCSDLTVLSDSEFDLAVKKLSLIKTLF